MAYKLGRKESAAAGIKRIVAEQIENSLKAAQRKTNPNDDAVHTLRKRLKQVRAALRLVRDDMGENLFRQENAVFRDAARPLSEMRDAAVMIETLDQLLRHSPDKIRPEAFKPLRDALSERRDRIRTHAMGPQHTMERVEAILRDALRRVQMWPVRHSGWKAVKPGLQRNYKQGREAMANALQDGSDEAMHQWRKRVKYQWHHLEILCNSWKEILEPLARQAHTLSDLLGEHHDLAVLRQLVNGELSDALEKNQHETVLALLSARQKKLQKKAAKLGRRLSEEREDEFISRLHGYWKAWR